MSHFGPNLTSLTAISGKPAMLLAVLVVVAGCAQQRSQQEANAALVEPEPAQPAYCQPAPAPDCEFKSANRRTVDPAEFARLKLAYERRCIRHAEKAERERMRELQAAGVCEGRPAPALATSR
ncbi:MAG TPA: hypothetical protein VJR30_05975 [Bradyrhizobium sp.]|nr:hypothetical protein [Bradyrhizobium sp.]